MSPYEPSSAADWALIHKALACITPEDGEEEKRINELHAYAQCRAEPVANFLITATVQFRVTASDADDALREANERLEEVDLIGNYHAHTAEVDGQ